MNVQRHVMLSGVIGLLREELANALAATGVVVHHADVGNLLDAVEEHAPHLLILGQQLPATQLTRTIRDVRDVCPTPTVVLVIIASAEQDPMRAALEAGADDFVAPPHDLAEILVRAHGCLQRSRSLGEMADQKKDAAALLELSQTLGSSLDTTLVLHSAARLMAQALEVDRCAIVLVDTARHEGLVVAVSEDKNIRDLRVSLDRYPEITRVVETGAPLVIEDTSQDPLLQPVRDADVPLTGSSVLFPILVDERVFGVFFLRSPRVHRRPRDREMQFGMTVAHATGAAIRNARLLEGERESTQRISAAHERAEERIQDLQKYEAFFEDAADGMVILDKEGAVLYANREGARHFGISREAMARHNLGQLLSPDSANELRTVLNDVMRGRYRRGFDLYTPRPDDGEACLSCSAGSVGAGASRLCMLSFRDVTEMHEMQTELRTTKEFLENLINSSVDAIIAADTRGNVILFNKGAEQVYGWRADEVVGRMPVSRLYPQDVAKEIMRQLRSNDHGGRGRLRAIRKDVQNRSGERVPVELTASIIYENGQEVATVGIFTDLRERLKMESQLSSAQARLLEAEKATVAAQLAGAAAHELNQPLTSVLGYAEMLRRRVPDDSPLRRSVDIIFKEGERMADIVRKIGKVTKWETKSYVGNTLIMDIEKASEPMPRPPRAATPAQPAPQNKPQTKNTPPET